MTLVTCTPEHAARLKALHEKDPKFGVIGGLWASKIATMMQESGCISFLDYGCGRSRLKDMVQLLTPRPPEGHYAFQEYDPATMPGSPLPADFVACIDVLEHVEADKVGAVLEHLRALTNNYLLLTISLRNGKRGKEATHPNVHTRQWWFDRIDSYFHAYKEISPLDPTKAKSELAVLIRTMK